MKKIKMTAQEFGIILGFTLVIALFVACIYCLWNAGGYDVTISAHPLSNDKIR